MTAFEKAISKQAKPKAAAAKKNQSPVIELPPRLGTELSEYLEAKKAKKEAEAVMAKSEADILSFCMERQDGDALLGEFSNSYSVVSEDTTVKYYTTDRFSVPQDPEVLAELKKAAGDSYDKIIQKDISVTLKPEVLSDKALQKTLMAALGDRFSEFFNVTESYRAPEGLKEALYGLAGSKEKLDEIRAYVKQAKPSLR